MSFAIVTLGLDTSLHIGAGRTGMVARCLGFVPGHVISYALAAEIGKQLGAKADDFGQALQVVRSHVRCGPFLICDGDYGLLFPRIHRDRIESRYLIGATHATLELGSRAAVDGGLFEVEAIARAPLGAHGSHRTELCGVVWYTMDELEGRSLQGWFDGLLLGGEIKSGMGRIRCTGWAEGADDFCRVGTVSEQGLHLKAGQLVPGPTLAPVTGVTPVPWVGRLYDKDLGAGRRMSKGCLVRMDGRCTEDTTFLPSESENHYGCWVSR